MQKNSNEIINNIVIEIARPSIPSIKLMALIIATIINIVSNCAKILPISNNPKTPWRLSIINPLSIIIFAKII
jgi:hypothetical protein